MKRVELTVLSLNRSVRSRDLLQGENRSSSESAHESELDSVLLENGVLVESSELHEGGHVDLVEGGEGSGGVLGLLQTFGDSQTHSGHLDLLGGEVVVVGRRRDKGGLGLRDGGRCE